MRRSQLGDSTIRQVLSETEEFIPTRVLLTLLQCDRVFGKDNLPRVIGPDGNTQISVAPDGSAVFTRDIGTQEIYALTVKWP